MDIAGYPDQRRRNGTVPNTIQYGANSSDRYGRDTRTGLSRTIKEHASGDWLG